MAIKKLSELDPNRPQPAPLEYVGKWVAWHRDLYLADKRGIAFRPQTEMGVTVFSGTPH